MDQGADAADERDRALLAAHVGGDPTAFDTLVRLHRERLWAVALRTLGEPEEAADAVQDACLSAYRSAATYRGDARVTTWLHRIVVNACLDRLRRRAARPAVPLPEQLPADPRDHLAERETELDVERALAALPLDQRTAIVLVDLQGLSVQEAATALGVPTGTVKSRCSRGRARLALALGHLAPSTRTLPTLTPARDLGQRNPQSIASVPPAGDGHHEEGAGR